MSSEKGPVGYSFYEVPVAGRLQPSLRSAAIAPVQQVHISRQTGLIALKSLVRSIAFSSLQANLLNRHSFGSSTESIFDIG